MKKAASEAATTVITMTIQQSRRKSFERNGSAANYAMRARRHDGGGREREREREKEAEKKLRTEGARHYEVFKACESQAALEGEEQNV